MISVQPPHSSSRVSQYGYSLIVCQERLTLFAGSAISWQSSVDPIGARALISVDGGASTTVDQSENAQGLDRARGPETLFSRTDLDGTQEHTIEVSYAGDGQMGGGYLAIFGFM
jgi:hypothetical protein